MSNPKKAEMVQNYLFTSQIHCRMCGLTILTIMTLGTSDPSRTIEIIFQALHNDAS